MAPTIGSTSIKILLSLAFCLILLLAFILANRRGRLLVAWLFIVLTLILPPSLVVENEGPVMDVIYQFLLPDWRSGDPLPSWADLLALPVFLLPTIVLSFGLILATVLFASGIDLYLERARNRAGDREEAPPSQNWDDRFAGVSLVLSGLVLAVTLYNLYWLMVLDNTTDSVGIFWLVFTAPAGFFCVSLLFLHLLQRATWGGLLYAILIPALIIIVSMLAWRVDYRALTEARAERVGRAIEAYYDRNGHYPESLEQLAPRYALSLLRPVIINGQDWCYEGDEDGYVFGYVDREHWSSPDLFEHLSGTGGSSTNLPNLCESEIEAIHDLRGW
jgi:hypothetical protein